MILCIRGACHEHRKNRKIHILFTVSGDNNCNYIFIIVLITGHNLSISGSSLNYIVYILIFYLSVSPIHFIYRYRKYKTVENLNTYIPARKAFVITSLIALELNVFTLAFVLYAFCHPEASLPIPFDPNILFISCFISIIAWGISLVTVICSYFVLRWRGLL